MHRKGLFLAHNFGAFSPSSVGPIELDLWYNIMMGTYGRAKLHSQPEMEGTEEGKGDRARVPLSPSR